MPTPTALGGESQINSYTTGAQEFADVATLADGKVIVTWVSDGQDGDSYGVFAQLLNADGTASGDEFRVNDTTADRQDTPNVVALTGGGFVIIWASSTDSAGLGVYGQRYDSDGSAAGSEFQVNTDTAFYYFRPAVAATDDGGFLVSWTSYVTSDFSDAVIQGQRFSADGTTSGSEFQINSYDTGLQYRADAAGFEGGGSVVTWTSADQDGDGGGVFGQLYDDAGDVVGSEFQINTTTASDQFAAKVATLEGGGFIVVWNSSNQDGDGVGIYGQLFDASGAEVGSEFRVNTETSGDQARPTVGALPDGGFIVTWASDNQDGSGYGVFGQRFTADGTANGSEFQINSFTDGAQSIPAVSVHSDGTTTVVWHSDAQDGDGNGIFMQRFSTNELPTGSDTTLSTDEDTALTLATGNFGFSDDDGDSFDHVVIDSISGGTLSHSDTGTLTAADTISAADLDAGKLSFRPDDNINGSGAGTFTFRVHDGVGYSVSANTVTFDVTAVNDAATIGGVLSANIGEDDDTVSGVATSTDVDNTDDSFTAQTVSGTYGDLTMAVNGAWSYDLDSTNETVQALNDGDSLTDALTVTSEDGTEADITITINGADDVSDRTPIADGSQTQLNEYTTGTQNFSSVAALSGDRLIAVWSSDGQDGSDNAVIGRIVNQDGSFAGEEFQINSYTTNSQAGAAVAALENGGFVVVWQSFGQDGSYEGIYGQRFDDSGTAVDGEFLINSYTTNGQYQPDVLAITDGGFLVVWSSSGQDVADTTPYADPGVYGQRFDENGDATGDEFQVNSYTAGLQFEPKIVTTGDSGFVVLWTSRDGQDGSGAGIFGQRFDSDGDAVGGEFQVNTYTDDYQITVDATATEDGGFVVVWQSNQQDGASYGVFAQRYDDEGSAVGNEFQVNTTTAGDQFSANVTSLAGGGFVVFWSSSISGDTGTAVMGQRFDADGAAVGDEFQVNSLSHEYNWADSATGLTDGDIVVSFTAGTSGTAKEVFFQRFSTNALPTGSDTTLTTDEDTALSIETSDFGFSDEDSDSLDHVVIDSFSGGTLSHADTGALMAADTISAADLDSGKLTFTPDDSVNGSGAGSFTFRVHDGIAYSAGANTVTIDVNAVSSSTGGNSGNSPSNRPPAVPEIVGSGVMENAPGAPIGLVSSSDPDGDRVTLSVSDGRFEIVNGVLKLRDGIALDFEEDSSVDLRVTATDSRGATSAANVTIAVGDDVSEPMAIAGGDMADTLSGGDTRDIIMAGAGNDSVSAGAGDDRVDGGDGDDSLDGGVGSDLMMGGAGNDFVTAGDGDDIVWAGTGDAGDDTLSGGDGSDTMGGGAGSDSIDAGAGNDQIFGREGADNIVGGEGDDYIWSGEGDDTVNGGSGSDTIWAGAGDDLFSGGEGADLFEFGAVIGNDIISDFSVAEDVLHLSFHSQFTDLASVQAAATVVDGGIAIDFGDSGTVVLQGVALSDISEQNLIFFG